MVCGERGREKGSLEGLFARMCAWVCVMVAGDDGCCDESQAVEREIKKGLR